MAKRKRVTLFTREDVYREMFASNGSVTKTAKVFDIDVRTFLKILRAYRRRRGPKKVAAGDKNFKDPFPSRNIDPKDKADSFGEYSYKHHWMENPEEATVGKVMFPYNPNR